MKRCITTLLVVLITAQVFAEDQAGTQTPFSLGVGSRDLALGGSFISQPSSATGLYWNPAALSAVQRFSFTGFHTRLFESGITYQYAGIAVPTLRAGTFAFGFSRIGVSDIEVRDGSNQLLGQFDDSRLDFRFGYGSMLGKNSIGASLHLEHHSLYQTSSTSTPGLDLAASRGFATSWQAIPNIGFALVGRNVVPQSQTIDGDKTTFPVSVEAGTTIGLKPWWHGNVAPAFSGAAVLVNHVDPTFRAGAEVLVASKLALRAGMREGNWTVGAGVQWKGYSFDYALLSQDLDELHLISFSVALGASKDERLEKQKKQEEARVNAMMENRLAKQQEQTTDSLIAAADSAIQANNLQLAENCLSRALFFATMMGKDTTEIAERRRQIAVDFAAQTRHDRITALEDTTRTAITNQNWQAANYYADLLLVDSSTHEQARVWKEQAIKEMSRLNSRETLVNAAIARADSLVNVGQQASALATLLMAQSLEPNHQLLRNAIERVHSQFLEQRVEEALASRAWDEAQLLLDSANTLYPTHVWIAKLTKELADEKKEQAAKKVQVVAAPKPKQPVAPPALSKEVQQKAQDLYTEAAKQFTAGELHKSILLWEQVEEIAPNYKDVHDRLFQAYKYVGVEAYGRDNLESAVAAWKDALAYAPGNKEVSEYIRRAEIEIERRKKYSNE